MPTTIFGEPDTMRDFSCPNCGQRLAFENSVCLSCGSHIGFDLAARDFAVLDPQGTTLLGPARRMCANLNVAECNWLVPVDGPALCRSCSLTRTRPADGDPALPAFAEAEAAKRRLVVELVELSLPINDREADPEKGLTFDLLSSQHENVITGHDSGVVLAETGPARERFEQLFGDPDLDYQEALDRHYSQGAPEGWEDNYVSSYATMHPAEDWAETFAHYLHIRDTIDTAAAFGFAPAGAAATQPLPGDVGFDRMIALWLPLAWSLNMINRSMGHKDLYPFVLPPKVLDKMRLVHRLVAASDTPAEVNAAV